MDGCDGTFVILDVGHGNCSILRHSDSTFVVDAGYGSSLLEFIEEAEIETISTVLLSHADQDHIGGLIQLLSSDTVNVDCVRLNRDLEQTSDIWQDLLYELEDFQSKNKIVFHESLTTEDNGTITCGDVSIEILHPTREYIDLNVGEIHIGRKITRHSRNVVVRLAQDGRKFALLPGDLDKKGFEEIENNGTEVSAKLIVFPHHGGKPGASEEEFANIIIEKVSPEVIIFSIGRGIHNTPRPEIVKSLINAKPDIRILCTQLSEHCSNHLPVDPPTHLLATFSNGREKRRCCAGSILINLDSVATVLPDEQIHRNFIKTNTSSALCSYKPKGS